MPIALEPLIVVRVKSYQGEISIFLVAKIDDPTVGRRVEERAMEWLPA
jgi:hypothetical protein